MPLFLSRLLLSGLFVVSIQQADSQPAVFTLDPDQSEITVSGELMGFTMQAQAPGSLTTKFEGVIHAAVQGNAITFAETGSIQARNNGTWQPSADGTTGSAPANYGGQIAAFLVNAKAAVRNIELRLLSDALPLNNGQFDSKGVTFFFPSNGPSSFAYNSTGLVTDHGSKPLEGYATNNIATLSSFVSSGGQETITIPVDATFRASLFTTNDTLLTVKGALVAVRAAVSPLRVESISVGNQMITLQWQTEPGKQFRVLFSADLQNWQTNTSSVSSATTSYAWSTPLVEPRGFFLLQQQNPQAR